jgi:Fe-S-cluster containining protein
VLLTLDDIFRLSEKLGLKPGAFYKKYCLRSGRFNSDAIPRIYLKTEGGCPFLKDGMCSVHDAKPVVCAENPFYYVESSLAAYRVFGIIQDECCISLMPYDTVTKGDVERLIDMEILVKATDDYMVRYGKFDEKTAAEYREQSLSDLKNKSIRAETYTTLLDQAIRREDMCRNDPYYKGAMGMYLSGFYRKYFDMVKQAKKDHKNVLSFQPSALGVIDGVITLVLFNEDYKAVKNALNGHKDADIHIKLTFDNEMEYLLVTIPDGDRVVLFYYHTDRENKNLIKRTPGKLLIDFREEKGGHFVFRGNDADAWLTEPSQ